MTAIAKADIITDVNLNLATSFSGTQLDNAIIRTLMDMSHRGLLVGTDSSQTLVSGDLTLNFPTGYRSAISITLIDSDSAVKAPLIKLPGGHLEYRELRENDAATGEVQYYSEFNEKIYLWRPPGQAYTTLIEYRKNHAKTADTIEFSTDFENLVFAGTTFWKACSLSRSKSIEIWGAIYRDLLQTAVLNRREQPSITRG
jgi:hypothetical protein